MPRSPARECNDVPFVSGVLHAVSSSQCSADSEASRDNRGCLPASDVSVLLRLGAGIGTFNPHAVIKLPRLGYGVEW